MAYVPGKTLQAKGPTIVLVRGECSIAFAVSGEQSSGDVGQGVPPFGLTALSSITLAPCKDAKPHPVADAFWRNADHNVRLAGFELGRRRSAPSHFG